MMVVMGGVMGRKSRHSPGYDKDSFGAGSDRWAASATTTTTTATTTK